MSSDIVQASTVVQDKPALSLKWSCGFAKDVVGAVHSLNGSELFYPAAHIGVIYDSETGVQRLLQGHINPISAVTVSSDKNWIVTADTGSESMLCVWDRWSAAPIKILFSPYNEGVAAVDITSDSKYLVTLSAPEVQSPNNNTNNNLNASESDSQNLNVVQSQAQNNMNQTDPNITRQYLSVWDWTSVSEQGPIITALIGAVDIQRHVTFNVSDSNEIATTGRRRVFFWAWESNNTGNNNSGSNKQPGSFQFYSPALASRDFKQKISDFTMTIFVPESTQAATGTTDGDIIIWDLSLIVDGLSRPDERRAVKILKLLSGSSMSGGGPSAGPSSQPEGAQNTGAIANTGAGAGSGGGPTGGAGGAASSGAGSGGGSSSSSSSSDGTSLNVLKVQEPFLVVGSSDGAVRFYDYSFRLQAWFEDLSAGAVTSLSFDNKDHHNSNSMGNSSDQDGNNNDNMNSNLNSSNSNDNEDFKCPSFLVATASALVVSCQSELFFRVEAQQRRGKLVLQGLDSPVHGICCHPSQPLVAVCGLSGFIHLWSYNSNQSGGNGGGGSGGRRLQTVKIFEKILPCILSYSNSGLLSVGFTNGQVRILDSNLSEVAQFRDSRDTVIHLTFDESSNYLAVAYADKSICLYKYDYKIKQSNKDSSDNQPKKEWIFTAKHRTHWRSIVGLCFSEQQQIQSNIPAKRLYSLAEDRKLIEYDLSQCLNSDQSDMSVPILSQTQVEQEARPTGLMYLRPNPTSSSSQGGGLTNVKSSDQDQETAGVNTGDDNEADIQQTPAAAAAATGAGGGSGSGGKGEGGILTMNDEFKFKIFRNRNCRSTSLCPTYGGPLNRLLPITDNTTQNQIQTEEDQFYLYSTHQKVIGLIQAPFDGNPHRYIGVIAHPREISSISIDYERKFCFTAGGSDLTVNMWNIDTQPVVTASLRGGSGIEPFLTLLETPSSSSLTGSQSDAEKVLNEIRDYFYYAQIRSKGERTQESRQLDNTIPLSEIPGLMSALGCYPSQMEITNMISQVKYSKFDETGNYTLSINFDEFIRLYINHRPVFELDKHTIEESFCVATGGMQCSKQSLLTLLTEYGERLTKQELEQCLESLTGESVIEGELVDAKEFSEEVLGFTE